MEARRVNLAVVIESLGPGGAERQVTALVRNLDRERFSSRVLTYADGDFFRPTLERAGIPVHFKARRGKLDPRPVIRLARWLRSGEVDIIQSYLYTSNFYAVVARRLAGRGRVVASERCLLGREHGACRIHAPWALRRADRVVANSECGARELVSRFGLEPRRVHFIPNGLDLDTLRPASAEERRQLRQSLGWPEERTVLLAVSSFKRQKDPERLLRALAQCRQQVGGAVLFWAGAPTPPEGFARVREGVRSLGLEEAVLFMGPRQDVGDLYRAADLFVLASSHEGTPNVVLEALACGCPVVATAVSDVPRYVITGRTGWLVPAGDPEALAEALAEACAAPAADLRALGLRGRAHVESLGLDAASLARRHEALYEELLAPDRSTGSRA